MLKMWKGFLFPENSFLQSKYSSCQPNQVIIKYLKNSFWDSPMDHLNLQEQISPVYTSGVSDNEILILNLIANLNTTNLSPLLEL